MIPSAHVVTRARVPTRALFLCGRFLVLAVALLVLLARAARTWIVAADLRAVAAHRLGLRGFAVAGTLRGATTLATLRGSLGGGLLGSLVLGLVRRAVLDEVARLLGLQLRDLLFLALDLDAEQLG